MNAYKLLTPGPLTTSASVKEAMLCDRCTWDEEYKEMTQNIRRELLAIAQASPELYTSVLLQGSGSYGVEATLATVLGKQDKCLIVVNGAYGERMAEMAKRQGKQYVVYRTPCWQVPDTAALRTILEGNPAITHVAMVHCETTTGILNPLDAIAAVVKEYHKLFIVDAMSSFGGVEIRLQEWGIDYLISSANKCLEGVPGFCFILAKRSCLEQCAQQAGSLVLDVYDQWREMEQSRKWRYTSPTHAVAAFAQALAELRQEGGSRVRAQRYAVHNQLLRSRLSAMGFASYIATAWQSPIITTFRYPETNFSFSKFYEYLKLRGFVIYPGKLTDADTFRIGNIGDIKQSDIENLCCAIQQYMEEWHARN